MPSPSISDFVYAALLYTGESPANPSSAAFEQGTKADGSDNLIFSFQRPDEKSGLTLEVFAFKAGTAAADFSKDAAILSGKTKNTLTVSDGIETIDVNETIALEVNKSSTEKGMVSLKVTVPDGCTLTIDDTTHFDITDNAPDFTLVQKGDGIPIGTYSVTFTVKKVDGDKTEIIHIFPESINVLHGMCTDTWSGLAKGAAKVITQDMASTTVYVRGKDAPWYTSNAPSATASDENSGSYLAPLATIQKAVDTIIARNDGTSEYTICIDGILDGTTADYIGENGMADFSALTKNLNLTIKALSGTATLDGGAQFDENGNVTTEGIKKRIILAQPANGVLNLTLEKLVITGGYSISGLGGGIVFGSSGGELKISNGTTICGNKAMRGGGVAVIKGTFDMSGGIIKDCTGTDYGGGVYISSGKFIMKGGAIYSNKASSYGGGVFVLNGTFTMQDSTISNCTAEYQGGGVHINYNVTFNMSGTAEITGCKTTATDSITGGGGIYNAGTLTITGGTISDCTSATSGGGIYNNVTNASITSTIENCEISGCKAMGTAYNNGYGGGIFNESGALELTDVNITGGNDTDNQDARGGGGIYNKGSLTVTGGTISKCTSLSGGGVFNTTGTLKITGSTISNCTAITGNGGGISTSGTTTTAEIINCNIESCTTNNTSGGEAGGGGIYCYQQELTLTGGTISNCTSANQGGGISIVSYKQPFTIDGVEITNCNAKNGGGCYIRATAAEGVTKEIKNCIIKSCEATTGGGGIGSTEQCNITVSGTEISECVSPSGSGIYSYLGGSSLLLKNSTIKNDVCTNIGVVSIYLAGSTTVTEGVIDFSSSTSTNKAKLYVQDELTQRPVAKIKLGTAYQVGDTILQAAGDYTLTEADCKRFSIDGGTYGIALEDGNGVLAIVDEIYLNSSSGNDAKLGLTASNAVQTLSEAIKLFDSQNAQKIMVCAEYTLSSSENDLLDRLGGG